MFLYFLLFLFSCYFFTCYFFSTTLLLFFLLPFFLLLFFWGKIVIFLPVFYLHPDCYLFSCYFFSYPKLLLFFLSPFFLLLSFRAPSMVGPWVARWIHGSLAPPVCLSICPSHMPCLLCTSYSSGWILSMLGKNDHWHEKVCRAQWPVTHIFKVIQPWLQRNC